MAFMTNASEDRWGPRAYRERFLGYDELTDTLHRWARAFPDVARVESIGKSLEGRELWLLTIGTEPTRCRPSVWVDGNMHASELCGSSVALAIAEELLRLHVHPDEDRLGLPQALRQRLQNVRAFVLPRMSPDGAEAVLRDGRYVRSNPRLRRPPRARAYWTSKDVDGDGAALLLRVRDEGGEFVEDPERPGLLLPRRVEDEGPFFKLYPEGIVENFDGKNVPDPYFLSDNDTDLNRNFPWSWRPEPDQAGAGAHPMSEPEARAVVEFVDAHPEIFAWLNLHTFGGVYIRPLGNAPDPKMDPSDLAIFRQIGEWGEVYGGYPMVSGFEEFVYRPDQPLYGDITDYGYHQRGILAYVCELWDLFRVLGIGRKKPFTDHYTQLTRAEMQRYFDWDRVHNRGRVFQPWKAASHPQLGEVEVGGLDPRVGLYNPPLEEIAAVCDRQASAFLRVAAMVPEVRVRVTGVAEVGGDVRRVDLCVENAGYLPSYGIASAKKLDWNEPLVLRASGVGCELIRTEEARVTLGHLEGWGRGLFDGDATIFHPRSRGSVSRAHASVHVKGRGTLRVNVQGPRIGEVALDVPVGD